MALYLIWHDPEAEIDEAERFAHDMCELRPGLFFVDSELTRSRLHHRIKWALPGGTALLTTRMTESAKFKGLAPGSLKWLRARGG